MTPSSKPILAQEWQQIGSQCQSCHFVTNIGPILVTISKPFDCQPHTPVRCDIIYNKQRCCCQLQAIKQKSKYSGKQCRDYKSTGYCARGRSCWLNRRSKHQQQQQQHTETTKGTNEYQQQQQHTETTGGTGTTAGQ